MNVGQKCERESNIKKNIELTFNENERLYTAINEQINKGDVDIFKVKYFLTNARSALDYLAHYIAIRLEIKRDDIYFPLTKKGRGSFEGSAGRNLHGLASKNEALYSYLESIQPYHNDYIWLGHLIALRNISLHERLIKQLRKELKALRIKSRDNGLNISGDASIRMGNGCFIKMGNAIIEGPQILSSDSEQIKANQGLDIHKIKDVCWEFEGKIPAIWLLNNIYKRIPIIVDEVYKILETQTEKKG